MSYVRFGEEGSDVYVYSHAYGGFVCDMCRLEEENWTFVAMSRSGMIAHLREHIAAGHVVPECAIERLEEEIEAEGDEWQACERGEDDE